MSDNRERTCVITARGMISGDVPNSETRGAGLGEKHRPKPASIGVPMTETRGQAASVASSGTFAPVMKATASDIV